MLRSWLFFFLLCISSSLFAGQWLVDNGCKVWDKTSRFASAHILSAECKDGYIEGFGSVIFYPVSGNCNGLLKGGFLGGKLVNVRTENLCEENSGWEAEYKANKENNSPVLTDSIRSEYDFADNQYKLNAFIEKYKDSTEHQSLVRLAKTKLDQFKAEQCKDDFQKATSSVHYSALIVDCKNVDLAIAEKSKLRKNQALKNEQAEKLYSLVSEDDYKNFIDQYAANDFAGLLPEAKRRLLRLRQDNCNSEFKIANSVYDLERLIIRCQPVDSSGLIAKAKSQIQVIIERDRKAKIEEEKWAAQACDRLYPGKPVKVSVQSVWGELFYKAVIVGVSARNGVASAKVTESGSYYGQIAERNCQSF